jgi:hypothetical protein
MLKKLFQRILKKSSMPAYLEPAGFDLEIDGEKKAVYQFKESMTVATGRYLVFLQFCNELAQNADRNFLKESLQAIQKDVAKNNQAHALGKMALLIETLDNYTPLEQYLNMATVFFVVEGEDSQTYDYDLAQKKKDAFSKIPNKVFFWELLGKALTVQGWNFKGDTLSYLEAVTGDKQRQVAYKVITS